MKTETKIYELLYVSTIAPTAPIRVVADIAVKSRTQNASRNITGLLIFDGMRFCQQIEGEQADVLAMIEHIRQDSRHAQVTVFHHGPVLERRFKNFSLAFTDAQDVETLGRFEKLEGHNGVAAFVDMLDTLELEA